MAKEYPLDENYIIYKAKSFATDKNVSCILWSPKLVKIGEFVLTELEYGLYWFLYDFNDLGIYVALFFEDGEPIIFHTFRVVSGTWKP